MALYLGALSSLGLGHSLFHPTNLRPSLLGGEYHQILQNAEAALWLRKLLGFRFSNCRLKGPIVHGWPHDFFVN